MLTFGCCFGYDGVVGVFSFVGIVARAFEEGMTDRGIVPTTEADVAHVCGIFLSQQTSSLAQQQLFQPSLVATNLDLRQLINLRLIRHMVLKLLIMALVIDHGRSVELFRFDGGDWLNGNLLLHGHSLLLLLLGRAVTHCSYNLMELLLR